jgi:hypothetical protein
MKVIHSKISACKDCPFGDQDRDGVYCMHVDARDENHPYMREIFNYKEPYDMVAKYGSEFPDFCPLPDDITQES